MGVLGWSAATLPADVPQPYGFDGRVTTYTTRGTYLVGAGAFVAVLVTTFAGCTQLLRRIGLEWFSVPDRWKQPQNAGRLRQMVADDLWVLGGATLLLFAVLGAATVVVADTPEPRLPWWWHTTFAVYVVAALVWCGVVVRRRYAAPRSTAAEPPAPTR